MDSITHIALGAVAGEAIAGKELGKRAMFYGAIAQSLPDIDFIGAFFLNPVDNLLFHRGFTHSIFFAAISSVILALIIRRLHEAEKIPLKKLILFIAIEISLHLVLDVCNAYGIGLLEPFSTQRFSFHVLFVVDPFYSVAPGISMLILIYMDSKNPARRFWIAFGLLVSSGYFLYAISNKFMIVRETTWLLEKQNLPYERLLTTPTPMNTLLWYVAVETDTGYFTGYRAIADDINKNLKLTFVPRNQSLLNAFSSSDDVKKLVRFSEGYYVVTHSADTVLFNDLRFGQIAGWVDTTPKYVFHYYLNYPDATLMVIQRGRFSNWNRKTFSSMIDRMKGHD